MYPEPEDINTKLTGRFGLGFDSRGKFSLDIKLTASRL